MEIELAEIRDFLARFPPFTGLDHAVLDSIPGSIIVRYFRQDSVLSTTENPEPGLYIVRSGALEIRDQGNRLIDKLAEGDSLYLDSNTRNQKVACTEDSLVYILAKDKYEQLLLQNNTFREQFAATLNQRLRSAVEQTHSADRRDLSAMHFEVSGMTDRAPLVIDSSTSIQRAAELMSREKVSSLLVMDNNELSGLLTDRDIRRRCVARGLAFTEPVSRIMTRDLKTVTANTLLSDALLLMTRNQINHLPVLRDNQPVGILTTTDMIRHLSTNATLIATDISKADSVDALKRISSRLPDLQLQLSLSSATAKHIGEVFSSITDAMTCRLLQLAEQKYGAAPVSYTWLAGGSQARNEQTSHSDQDNALLLSDDYHDDHETYFKNLAEFVCDGLDACGYIYCPGDAMARNPQWRQPLKKWQEYFSDWIEHPEPKALMLSSIFFDLRLVYGDSELFQQLQDKVLKLTRNNEFFIAQMVKNALTHQPPIGFFRNFVMVHDREHKNTLDIKHRGVVPVVDIARVLALDNGLSATNTIERLDAALQSQALSEEMHDNLCDAFEYIASLRIRHQARQIRSGIPADNFLPPAELSGLEKNHLRDAFMVIKTMQQFFESRYNVALIR